MSENKNIINEQEPQDDHMIEGRNAVLEAFRAGKTIDKLYIQDGLRDGVISSILRDAKKKDVIALLPRTALQILRLDVRLHHRQGLTHRRHFLRILWHSGQPDDFAVGSDGASYIRSVASSIPVKCFLASIDSRLHDIFQIQVTVDAQHRCKPDFHIADIFCGCLSHDINDGIPDMLFFLQCGYRKVKAGQIFGK